jgi:hypothetical protein
MYVHPEDRIYPRSRLTLNEVVYNGGEAHGALAIGLWDGNRHLLMCWNGGNTWPKGYPVGRAGPGWYVVPPEFVPPLLTVLDPVLRQHVRDFLRIAAQ